MFNMFELDDKAQIFEALMNALQGKVVTDDEDDTDTYKTTTKVFQKDGTITEVIIYSNKEISRDYITKLVPDFHAFVPGTKEIVDKMNKHKGARGFDSLDRMSVIKEISEAEYLTDEELVVISISAAYTYLDDRYVYEDFGYLPQDTVSSIIELKHQAEEYKGCTCCGSKKASKKNYHNIRDSKGRFTKAKKTKKQKRDRFGRFC